MQCRASPARASSCSSTSRGLRFRRGAPARREDEGEPGARGDGRAGGHCGHASSASASGRDTSEADIDRFLAEWRRIRDRARVEGGMIYLDYQATTPVAPEVAEAMQPWVEREVRQPALAVALGPRGGGGHRGCAQAGRDRRSVSWRAGSPSPGARPRRSTGRSRGRGEGCLRAATGSSPSLPSMRRCSIRASGSQGRGSTSFVLPVGADGLIDLDDSRQRSTSALPGRGHAGEQ